MQTIAERLTGIEAKRRRWQTRLKRAVTALDKLERQRKRLTGLAPKAEPLSVKVMKSLAAPVETDHLPEAEFEKLAEAKERDIPDFLDRSNPLIAEAMTAARKKAEEAERHKMPLTGRAALEAVRSAPRKRRKSTPA